MRRVRVQVKPNVGAKPAGVLLPAKPTVSSCQPAAPQLVPDTKPSSNDVEPDPCPAVTDSCRSPSKTQESPRIPTPEVTSSLLKSSATSSHSLLLPSENTEIQNCCVDNTDTVPHTIGATVSVAKVTDTTNVVRICDETSVAEPASVNVAKLPDGGKTANVPQPSVVGLDSVRGGSGKVEMTGDVEAAVAVAGSQSTSRPAQKPAGMTALASRLKAKPNIATNARVRHVSMSEKQPDIVSVATLQATRLPSADVGESPATGSTQESEAFIPPAAAETARLPTCLGPGIATEEIVTAGIQQTALQPSMQQPPVKERLTAEKAAEKMIQKRIQLKKKRRQLESLSGPIDRTKICMRDLIYLNPVNNPMKSPESKTGVKLSESTVDMATNVNNVASGTQHTDDVETDEVSPAVEENDAVAVPQVKVGPDGKITLNLDTVVIEKKLPAKEEKKEIVDETYIIRRGYPKKNRCRPWDVRETHKFYGLLSRIGTDFSLMARLFTDRTRMDLKRKFKREEKIHRDLVEKVLGERVGLDITLLAEPSDDEKSNVEPTEAGDEPPGSKKKKRSPRTKDDPSAGAAKAKRKSVKAEKENNKPLATVSSVAMATNAVEAMPPVAVATGDMGGAGALPGDGKSKKARKHQKRLYYEQSSESEDDLTSSSSSPTKSKKSRPGSSPGRPQGAEASSSVTTAAESSDDEVQVIQAIGGRATRAGRIPRPTFNPATSSPDETPLVRAKSEQSTARPKVSKSAAKVSSALPVAGGNQVAGGAVVSASPVKVSDIMSQIARMQQTPQTAGTQSLPLTATPSPLQFLPSGGTSVVSPGILGLPPGLFVLVEKPAGNPGSLANQPQSLFHVFALSSGPQDGTGPQGPMATTVSRPGLGPSVSIGGNPSLVVTSVSAPQIFPPYVAGSSSLTSLAPVSAGPVNSAFNSPRTSSPRLRSPPILLAAESRLPGTLANITVPTSADVVRPGLMAARGSPMVRQSASLSSVRMDSSRNVNVGPVSDQVSNVVPSVGQEVGNIGPTLTAGSVSVLGQQRNGSGPVSGQQDDNISHAAGDSNMKKLQAVDVPRQGQHVTGGLPAMRHSSPNSVPILVQQGVGSFGDGSSFGQPATASLQTLGQNAPGDVPTLGQRAPGDVPTLGQRAPGNVPTLGQPATGTVPTGSLPIRVIQLSDGSEDLILESDLQSSLATDGGEIPAATENSDDDGTFIDIIVEHFGESLD